MSIVDASNFLSAAVSTVLAIVALWLSLYFFRLSNEQARRAQTSADEITASVVRLEKLFGTFYTDTFSIMRETVSDMRAHIWTPRESGQGSSPYADAETQRRLGEAKKELLDEITDSSRRSGVRDAEIDEIIDRLEPAVTRALEESSEAGLDLAAKRAFLMSVLRAQLAVAASVSAQPVPVEAIQSAMARFGFHPTDVLSALKAARAEGWVSWDGDEDAIGPASRIVLGHGGA
ncbi:MAG TPA: hypothetical protein VH561_13720 [Micromonosporaceae bacterium]|jgi:hypothetical protein